MIEKIKLAIAFIFCTHLFLKLKGLSCVRDLRVLNGKKWGTWNSWNIVKVCCVFDVKAIINLCILKTILVRTTSILNKGQAFVFKSVLDNIFSRLSGNCCEIRKKRHTQCEWFYLQCISKKIYRRRSWIFLFSFRILLRIVCILEL